MLRFAKPEAPKRSKAAPQRPKRYRGAVRGTLVGVRLQDEMLARIDRYAKDVSRPEAIRRLIEQALG